MIVEKLPNNVMVYKYANPNLHSISIGLYIRVGSMYESLDNNGITHLLEHIHFRRLNNLSQENFYRWMESIGTTLKASTYKDFLRFYMNVSPKYLHEALDIFSELISTFNWSEYDLEEELRVVIDQIHERESYQKIDDHADKIVWGKHPLSYSIMGTEENLKKITLSQLITHKEDFFSTENLFIVITGSIKDKDNVLVNEIFSKIKFIKSTSIIKPESIEFKVRKPDILFVNRPWDFLDVRLSFNIKHSKTSYEEIILLNSILGGGVGSKLQLHIREKEGIASSIYSNFESYMDASIIYIDFSVHKNDIYFVLELICSILKEMKNTITEDDLAITLPFYTDNTWFLLDNPEELNFNIALDLILRNRLFSVENEI